MLLTAVIAGISLVVLFVHICISDVKPPEPTEEMKLRSRERAPWESEQ